MITITLQQKVKIACALREISVAELGRRIGLSQSNFFQRLQKGKFTIEELEKIGDALGCKYRCLVAEEETANLAKEKGITRSMAAVEIAARDTGRKLFVFGNAPTALYKAMEMRDSKELNLDAIVGVPVGFVGAAESKDELVNSSLILGFLSLTYNLFPAPSNKVQS